MCEEVEYLYRYEPRYYECNTSLTLFSYPVLKKTPGGCWIKMYFERKKFVLDRAKKKFAHPTAEEALVALAARNKRYIAILREKLRWAIETRDAVQKEMGK